MSVKITDLNNAGTLDGSEIVPIVQAGETVQTTAQDVANLCDISSICVNAGDTLTFDTRGFISVADYSNGGTDLVFIIPLNKIITATSVSNISGKIVIRGISGYLTGDQNGVSVTDTSLFSSCTCTLTHTGVKVALKFVTSPNSTINNTPVGVSSYNGFSLTFA